MPKKDVELKTIGVSFNIKDEWQKKLYDYAKSQVNSSLYIKRLIDDNMKGVQPQFIKPQLQEEIIDVNTAEMFI